MPVGLLTCRGRAHGDPALVADRRVFSSLRLPRIESARAGLLNDRSDIRLVIEGELRRCPGRGMMPMAERKSRKDGCPLSRKTPGYEDLSALTFGHMLNRFILAVAKFASAAARNSRSRGQQRR